MQASDIERRTLSCHLVALLMLTSFFLLTIWPPRPRFPFSGPSWPWHSGRMSSGFVCMYLTFVPWTRPTVRCAPDACQLVRSPAARGAVQHAAAGRHHQGGSQQDHPAQPPVARRQLQPPARGPDRVLRHRHLVVAPGRFRQLHHHAGVGLRRRPRDPLLRPGDHQRDRVQILRLPRQPGVSVPSYATDGVSRMGRSVRRLQADCWVSRGGMVDGPWVAHEVGSDRIAEVVSNCGPGVSDVGSSRFGPLVEATLTRASSPDALPISGSDVMVPRLAGILIAVPEAVHHSSMARNPLHAPKSCRVDGASDGQHRARA
nr:hypothetical protein CFP56_11742 [Quercus suber]